MHLCADLKTGLISFVCTCSLCFSLWKSTCHWNAMLLAGRTPNSKGAVWWGAEGFPESCGVLAFLGKVLHKDLKSVRDSHVWWPWSKNFLQLNQFTAKIQHKMKLEAECVSQHFILSFLSRCSLFLFSSLMLEVNQKWKTGAPEDLLPSKVNF